MQKHDRRYGLCSRFSSGGRWLWGINFLRSSFAPDVSASLYFIKKGLEVKITRLQTFMVSLLGAIFLSASANSQAILNPDNKLCIFAQKEALKDYAASTSSRVTANAKERGLMEGNAQTDRKYAENFLDNAAKHSLFYLAFCKN